ncbi:RHS repeat-associated core domain-containing protein [Serratia marcescens]|uniref:RHS repeat-associated core domain-containing protein n=1 Tax=Serratia marcescens TaxID=615 RepID=UPI001EF15439|nr:RHS repeat-associated core domain-containing protein [Serratia marcescens]ULH09884.1 RHS repeat-associated core domain-containing protein [Serratia marcescens]
MTNQSEHLAASPLDSPLGFNGERTDPALGSYHLGNGYRLYNPTLRRFTAPDDMSPFGVGGINPYAYCEGDPINNTDPTGHSPLSTIFLLGMLMIPGGGAVDDVAEGEAAMERHFTQRREADEERMGSNRAGKRAHSGTGDDNIAVRRARPDTAGPSTPNTPAHRSLPFSDATRSEFGIRSLFGDSTPTRFIDPEKEIDLPGGIDDLPPDSYILDYTNEPHWRAKRHQNDSLTANARKERRHFHSGSGGMVDDVIIVDVTPAATPGVMKLSPQMGFYGDGYARGLTQAFNDYGYKRVLPLRRGNIGARGQYASRGNIRGEEVFRDPGSQNAYVFFSRRLAR